MESVQGSSQEAEIKAISRLPAGDEDNSLAGSSTPIVRVP